jgi:hypothetical protein
VGALALTKDAVRTPRPDGVEVLMTLSLGQYADMGRDLEEARQKLKLPKSASNTDVILAAVHRLACDG